MDALRRNDTWTVVSRTVVRSVVGSRWVFKVKHNADGSIERYKARVVAKRFSRITGTDSEEADAPAIHFDSLRLLHTIALHNKWEVIQMDVESAFLYGKLDRDIYMEILHGFKESNMIYNLQKMYLRTEKISLSRISPKKMLTRYGLVPATFDSCIFLHNKTTVYVAVYFDDSLISCSDPKIIN